MPVPLARWALNSCCSSGLVMSAVVQAAVVLLPADYFRNLMPDAAPPRATHDAPGAGDGELPPGQLDLAFEFPLFDLFISLALMTLVLLTHLCKWIQRKLCEKRVVTLNQSLSAALERLRARDAQCDQLEAELKLVQNATLEYKLLLYLLLRLRACAPPCVPADCVFTKGLSGPLPVEA